MSYEQYPISVKKGKEKELEFAKYLSKYGYTSTFSSKHVDKTEHWDIELSCVKYPDRKFCGFELPLKIDIKKVKGFSRHSGEDDSVHWLEFKNVYGGTGWLRGNADIIAFETFNTWIIVNRKLLEEWADENTIQQYVEYPYQALGKWYNRYAWGKKDLTTLVKTDTLRELGKEFPKQKI